MRIKKGSARALWPAVFALAVVVTLSMPFALSKYAARGVGNGSARVAKWDPRVDLGAVPEWGKTILLKSDGGWAVASGGGVDSHWDMNYQSFYIQPPDNSKSEVRARFEYKLTYADGSDIPDATLMNGNWWLPYFLNGALINYPVPTVAPVARSETLGPGAVSSGVTSLKLFFHYVHRPNTFVNATGGDWGYRSLRLSCTITQVD